MLANRIIQTLKFFDLQDYPLTALEVERYLIADKPALRKRLNDQFELEQIEVAPNSVHLDTILLQLSALVQDGKISCNNGFYTLLGRENLIGKRLLNYRFAIRRQKLIRRYILFTKHLPFVRGIALGGSQALGLPKSTSDIDLLVITDQRFIWLARTALTIYFQIFGVRRHGDKITNRFCLNHYLAEPGKLESGHNLYAAMEYSRLIPLVNKNAVTIFQEQNLDWLKIFFPNLTLPKFTAVNKSAVQAFLEKVFSNPLGQWLENTLGRMQAARIQKDRFVFTKSDELSFHPNSKQEQLLQQFFSK